MTKELKNFEKAVGKILSVSHAELKRREEEWKKQRKRKKKPKSIKAVTNG